MSMTVGRVIKVSGPLVVAEGLSNANMFDVVHVGADRLIGEIIEMRGNHASIQVYEETAGLGLGAQVVSTGVPLSVELGPGLITTIYDGIQRPLEKIRAVSGSSIKRGVNIPALDRERKWDFKPLVEVGAKVIGGDFLGHVMESEVVDTKIMVPPTLRGTVVSIKSGAFTVTDVIAEIETEAGETVPVQMLQRWPVRQGRIYKNKLSPTIPMVTGQRNIDTLFPIARGGTAAIPGPFGSGKTIVQHQIAKWSDVDIVVYIGCGERGNEMTNVLLEFPELNDPRSGKSLMQRTVLVANTSDMPVAAREASIYTGITIAEFYRDMGYSVAILADSTSRWAEALREMSGRLEEMPGEEGYPAYLTSRLAQFYERAGRVVCIGSEEREGSLTAIGAVSPTGGDISEPVSQATLRIVKVFWSLDATLAYSRHFPAINWLNSYSLYEDKLSNWYMKNVNPDHPRLRAEAISILQKESELNEIVQLVGVDALSAQDRLTLEEARMLREDFLQQDAMSDTDSYCQTEKQFMLLRLILLYYDLGRTALTRGADMNALFKIPSRELIGRAKNSAEYTREYADIEKAMRQEIANLTGEVVYND